MPGSVSERALVLAPRGRDAAVAVGMLIEAGLEAAACSSLPQLVAEFDQGVGIAVITEEALATTDLKPLAEWLHGQEEWSDLPFVLLTHRGGGLERNPAASRHLEILGNVTFLERPFHPTTLVSLARSALRGRRRQYEARSRLKALHESEARYRLLFETLDEGFAVIKFLDGPHGPLSDYVHVEANPAYERHAGIANVVGQKVREMVPDEAGGWVELYRRVLTTGEPVRFERELVATGRHLDLAAFRVEPASRREVAVLFQDVTARRRAEIALRDLNETLERRVRDALGEREAALAQLHEAQKLETIGQITGGVAHDFNNLLTPITGALDLLQRRYAADDARAARLIDNALLSADRAKTLVQRLLGFARRQSLQTRAVDVSELLDGMTDLINSSVGAQIEVSIAASDGLPAAIADINQLELAILNLAVNARDAMPGGGRLTIAATHEVLGPGSAAGAAPGTYIRISVVDTGSGMDESTLAHAIEPFYSTKGIGKGTGLGLSMVHGLAAQLGGAFQLTSVVGEGTRADLFLPTAKGQVAEGLRRQSQDAPFMPAMRLLLVDDEELIRTGTAEMLRELGHTVVEATGGREALAMLEQGLAIDVLVTDYMMPQMDGAVLARRVLERQPDLPVLVVTGYAGGDLDIGHTQLAKPFRQADLAAALLEATNPRVVRLTRPHKPN
ncbi:response regulator [Phenylobacterium deserti]|uniref:histidine kinase n=1 Tax=Phenylobacterium deserti TaxID=1914756 RepID=A0A328A9S5_9CAUL|nr:response regulator [Phenylobacterium deserti]RAK51463.1 hybrid sensor histidine kinase/response regulator [Phenylobacterium deserti]